MRVLYFSRDYTTHDHRFLSTLADAGYTVYFLRLERNPHPAETRPFPAGIKEISWAGGQKLFTWKQGYRFKKDFQRVLSELNPDLIHAGPIQTCAFLSVMSGFHPIVSVSWGYDLLRDASRNPIYRQITRYTLRNSDVLVGDSEIIRQKAIEYGMAADRIVTFPWGINLKIFDLPAQQKKHDKPFTILSTRGWEPIYGIEILAQAFVLAAHQVPEMRLIMLGCGSLKSKLERIFYEGGVLDRVEFPGLVDQLNLPIFFHAADLYVSASFSDGTSISLIEAMATGCPVLVSDIPGNREWVTPGKQGWLFPVGEALALSKAVITAYEHREDFPIMGKQARALAVARANWENNFQQLLHAYDLAINSPKNGMIEHLY